MHLSIPPVVPAPELSGASDPAKDIGRSPRNVWLRYRLALELTDQGRLDEARRIAEAIVYHPEMSTAIHGALLSRLTMAEKAAGGPRRIGLPGDYLSHPDPRISPPFRRLSTGRAVPSPYPFSMVLPNFAGARNDYTFLQQAAAVLGAAAPKPAVRHIHVIWSAEAGSDPSAIAGQIARQRFDPRSFDGALTLTLCMPDAIPSRRALNPLAAEGPRRRIFEMVAESVLQPSMAPHLARYAAEADLIVFITGNATLDDTALLRAVQLANVTDLAVQPFVAQPQGAGLLTPYAMESLKPAFKGRYPFRDVHGLNYAVSAGLLRKVGLPDTGFEGAQAAGRELAYRLFNAGAYFVPLAVPHLDPEAGADSADAARLAGLCPNHWDRKQDSHFEVPKVSVYIPAYNASKYMERAVDSILAQDYRDLEVCIC